MKKELLNRVTEIKNRYLSEGFIIEGVFGSYTRGDSIESSDIDILYVLDDSFRKNYRGLNAISRLDDIQKDISTMLSIKADLVQRNSLGKISEKYILPEVIYV
jgi:predicted nucleotidyltransferase